jgi:hypothetical protein
MARVVKILYLQLVRCGHWAILNGHSVATHQLAMVSLQLPYKSIERGEGTKAESKTRKRKADDPEQYERFRQAARELETDDSLEAFDRTFRKIVPPKTRD